MIIYLCMYISAHVYECAFPFVHRYFNNMYKLMYIYNKQILCYVYTIICVLWGRAKLFEYSPIDYQRQPRQQQQQRLQAEDMKGLVTFKPAYMRV